MTDVENLEKIISDIFGVQKTIKNKRRMVNLIICDKNSLVAF